MSATLPPESATYTPVPELSQDEILRYSRHLILPDVGIAGQRKLKAAKVLLIGGGGHIGLVDFDVRSHSRREPVRRTHDIRDGAHERECA